MFTGFPLMSRPNNLNATCMVNEIDEQSVYYEYFNQDGYLEQGSCSIDEWICHVV
jgi:hypothetical protein